MPWSEAPAWLWPSVVGLLVSALGTVWAQVYARRQGLLDQPGERRSHPQPTARGGGVGIAIACGLTCCGLALTVSALWGWIGAGLVLVAAMGWWDDHRNLPAWPRLLAHLVAGGLLTTGLLLHGVPFKTAMVAWGLVPVLVNIWNFMDGIDGLAGSQAGLGALAAAAVLPGVGQVLAMAMVAACLGFLPFNCPKARIFLGDVGSGALGYLMAVLLALAMAVHPPIMWPVLLLPASLFLVDASMTLAWRVRHGQRWWQPHVQHLYQRLARRYGHPRVTAAYAGWTLLAFGSMLILMRSAEGPAFAGGMAWLLVTVAVWHRLHRKTGESEGISS